MLICSHRGYSADLPENTLEAFSRAVELGVDGIETDLRLSRDGAVVLYHNRHVADGRAVSELTHAELCDAAGYDVPTLEQALEAFPDVLWILEIKTPLVVAAAVEVIRRYQSSRRLLVISFWHQVSEQVRRQVDVECGLSISHSSLVPLALEPPGELGTRRIETLVWNFEFADEELLRQSAQAGWRIFVYGVESRREHERCRELGLYGVITDFPQYLLGKS